jgi:hypothetical protein
LSKGLNFEETQFVLPLALLPKAVPALLVAPGPVGPAAAELRREAEHPARVVAAGEAQRAQAHLEGRDGWGGGVMECPGPLADPGGEESSISRCTRAACTACSGALVRHV